MFGPYRSAIPTLVQDSDMLAQTGRYNTPVPDKVVTTPRKTINMLHKGGSNNKNDPRIDARGGFKSVMDSLVCGEPQNGPQRGTIEFGRFTEPWERSSAGRLR